MLTWTTYIQYAGLSGFFASRAFLSAFTFAMVSRFGGDIPVLADTWFIQSLSNTPDWFTHNFTLISLGILGTLELLSDKVPEVREFMSQFDSYLKAIMAAITSMGLLNQGDQKMIDSIIQSGPGTYLMAGVVGVLVFGLASIRSSFLGLLRESDSEDAVGIQKLISWAEDVYAFFGPLIFIFFPVAVSIIVFIIFAIIAWWVKRLELKEEKLKLSCSSCDEKLFRHATECPSCNAPNPTPHNVSIFGGSRKSINPIPESQPIHLVAVGRCPKCAEKLQNAQNSLSCSTCQTQLTLDHQTIQAFLAHQRSKLPIALVICALFSLIPVVGLIPGIIYYRLYLIAPFRRYIPTSSSLFLRWGIRILFFFLVAIQIIPAVGTITVPALAWISFESYRAAFLNQLKPGSAQNPGATPLPSTS